MFAVDEASGQISVAVAAVDFETRDSYALTLTAQDSGGKPLTARCTVTITVNDGNDPPVVDDLARSVPENTGAGITVGAPIVATDPDGNAAFAFQLGEAVNPILDAAILQARQKLAASGA